jgi:acylphosphatase
MAELVRARAIISGKVQGVFFRMETLEEARRTGVSGWVKNKQDGTVEAVFEGQKALVDSIIQWCRKGPRASRVDNVNIGWEPYTGKFTGFSIRY